MKKLLLILLCVPLLSYTHHSDRVLEIKDKKEIERITQSELEWLEIARTTYRLW